LGNGKTCSTYTSTFPTGVASCEWARRGGAASPNGGGYILHVWSFLQKSILDASNNVSRTAELISSVSQGRREAPSEHNHGAVLGARGQAMPGHATILLKPHQHEMFAQSQIAGTPWPGLVNDPRGTQRLLGQRGKVAKDHKTD
jgi:hypothetical protein